MTSLERAHIIVGFFWPDDPQPRHIKENEEYLAAQLDEACAEAIKEIHNVDAQVRDKEIKIMRDIGFQEGFRAAREKAKGILKKEYPEYAEAMIAYDRISRMEPE